MLTVDALTAHAGRTPLLSGVSLRLGAGERLAIVGASGSGKSLTARASLALPPAGLTYGGRVALDGRDLLTMSEADLAPLRGRDIAMIFQEPATALNPAMRIGTQIEEPLRIHTDLNRTARRERVAALLERTGLRAVGVGPERFPHQLSGGQRQRVAVAIALALSPRLVIADEPTSALDSVSAAVVLDLLVRLTAEEGAGLILITHDLAVARRAERIAVMDAGRVVEEGATAAFLKAPKSEAGQRLVAAARLVLPPHPEVRADAAPHVLSAEGVTVMRGARATVRDASIAIAAGERLALVGGSGSGKTTLMRAVLGLLPRTGTVSVHGTPVVRPDEPRLRQTARLVFQDPATSFNPRHSVRRIVTEPLYRSGLSRREKTRRATAALAAVGLGEDALWRKPHAFSGGQRQRIAIARALIAEPEILVADEAVSALDAAIKADIVRLLDRLTRESGIGLVFIAHDLGLVRLLADRIVVMDDGAIVEEGDVAQIFGSPRHPATRALVAEAEALA
ncbi:ABC transporter ATP-binding protein [Acuticoccus sp. M5D2P5]|uniref:nickel ABC transporter ATP-binding protein NikE n=1 Tax=Acuticoccus kalidii TaxID=2910977 RepID=UPI001F2F5821|nr:ABC transporter ATP-binding protein [Acuticoccus kalidii]MCF3936588.1 ABC transporter ATP-binding protein [Acuticoccus kalidii]